MRIQLSLFFLSLVVLQHLVTGALFSRQSPNVCEAGGVCEEGECQLDKSSDDLDEALDILKVYIV